MPRAQPQRPRPPFRPDIEGLRAVAVLAVVAFHAGAVDGGFVGVDVFFVISGFLITGLLWAELSATGRVRLARFYAARARRLLPAAAVVLVATAAAATALLSPLQVRPVLDDGLASALYVGNYRFAITGTDYLANSAPSPFQHYWSLGVEEQFYLLLPALMLGIAIFHRGRAAYVTAFLVVAGASLALSLSWTHSAPPWAFFSLPTRAWELAAGGLIAVTVPLWRRLPPGFAALAGLGGLTAIGIAVVDLDDRIPYPGTAALMPVLGTALVVGAGCARPTWGAGRILSLRWMRAIGRVSYSWYLWHWPVLVLAPLALRHPLGPAGRGAAVCASLLLALLTLRYVERPIRYARPLRISAGRSLAVGSALTAVAVSAALLLPMLVPAPVGRSLPAAVVHDAGANSRTVADGDPIAAAQAAVEAAARTMGVPADLSPPLADAAADKPDIFVDGCVRSWGEVGVPDCASGDVDGQTTVALVGDSHAAMWQPAMDTVAQQRHWRLVTMAKVTCPLQNLPIISPHLGRRYSECEQWRDEALDRLVRERPRLVMVGMSRRYGADFGFTGYDPAWMQSLGDLVADVRTRTGARVLVLGPAPDPHTDVPVCLSESLDDALACAPRRGDGLNAQGIAGEARVTADNGGRYADLSELFCAATICPVVVGNHPVFRDDNHLTVSYAEALAPALGPIAEQAMSPRS